MTFLQKLEETIAQTQSCLCVGLDPNLNRIPALIKEQYESPGDQVFHFLKGVVEHTSEFCSAYKPNLGFFEALGPQGLQVFESVVECIPEDKVIIADAKRGDISSTAEHYAKAYFERFDVDAITLNPLMGFDTLEPFLSYPKKGIYTLTLTSNPGADDFLNQPFNGAPSMATFIAAKLSEYDEKHATHVGMVVGATRPEDMEPVIRRHNKGALLIPGIGTQGGSVSELISVLEGHRGFPLINSSRSIIYAGQHANKWQQAVANKAKEYKELLNPLTEQYV